MTSQCPTGRGNAYSTCSAGHDKAKFPSGKEVQDICFRDYVSREGQGRQEAPGTSYESWKMFRETQKPLDSMTGLLHQSNRYEFNL